MFVPSSLKATISQVTSPDGIRACILLTPKSRLLAYASHPSNAEDLIKVLLGLAAEAWREVDTRSNAESRDENYNDSNEIAMIESELGRVFVLPIYSPPVTVSLSPSSSFASDHEKVDLHSTAPVTGGVTIPPSSRATPTSADSSLSATPTRSSYKSSAKFLLALYAPESIPWGFMRAKGRPLADYLRVSLAGISERLEAGSSASPPIGR